MFNTKTFKFREDTGLILHFIRGGGDSRESQHPTDPIYPSTFHLSQMHVFGLGRKLDFPVRTHADMERTCKFKLPHPNRKFDVVDSLAPAMDYTTKIQQKKM